MQAVGENWSCLVSRTLLTVFNPGISIVGNILIISKFTSLQSDVKVNASPGKMYSLNQTHKVGNPARVTTSRVIQQQKTYLFLLKNVYIQKI